MPRVNPTLVATPQPSIPEMKNETSSSKIGAIAITIIGLLASFVFLPFEAAIPIGAVMILGALCFNGCLNSENIRSTFMPVRPPAEGPRPLQPRVVDDRKDDRRLPIPVAVPVQPFTGYPADPRPHVRPPMIRPGQIVVEGKAPDPRMENVSRSLGSGRRPLRRPPVTGEREETQG